MTDPIPLTAAELEQIGHDIDGTDDIGDLRVALGSVIEHLRVTSRRDELERELGDAAHFRHRCDQLEEELTRCHAQIAALTRERDEARADATSWESRCRDEALTRSRTITALDDARAERDRLQAELDEARKVVEAVSFCGEHDLIIDFYSSAHVEVVEPPESGKYRRHYGGSFLAAVNAAREAMAKTSGTAPRAADGKPHQGAADNAVKAAPNNREPAHGPEEQAGALPDLRPLSSECEEPAANGAGRPPTTSASSSKPEPAPLDLDEVVRVISGVHGSGKSVAIGEDHELQSARNGPWSEEEAQDLVNTIRAALAPILQRVAAEARAKALEEAEKECEAEIAAWQHVERGRPGRLQDLDPSTRSPSATTTAATTSSAIARRAVDDLARACTARQDPTMASTRKPGKPGRTLSYAERQAAPKPPATFSLPREVHAEIARLANARNTSRSEVVADAIREFGKSNP